MIGKSNEDAFDKSVNKNIEINTKISSGEKTLDKLDKLDKLEDINRFIGINKVHSFNTTRDKHTFHSTSPRLYTVVSNNKLAEADERITELNEDINIFKKKIIKKNTELEQNERRICVLNESIDHLQSNEDKLKRDITKHKEQAIKTDTELNLLKQNKEKMNDIYVKLYVEQKNNSNNSQKIFKYKMVIYTLLLIVLYYFSKDQCLGNSYCSYYIMGVSNQTPAGSIENRDL